MSSRPFARPRYAGTRNARALDDSLDAVEWMRCARSGDFEGAWCASDRIRQRNGHADWGLPRHLQRVWDGSPLAGRRVLVRCYHGLGDTIQFIRYAPLLRSIAREVIVWAQPALLPLLQGGAAGIDHLIPLHDGVPDAAYDVDIEVMELPYAFRTTLATIPSTVPYLSAPSTTLDGPRPRIGLAWRSGEWNNDRSIPFSVLQPLLDCDLASWYGLHLDRRDDECHPRLRPAEIDGVLSTAAAMMALDLVVSVDSMPAHLAGALGRPVWTLVPRRADWRWMSDRAESPWYPTMRLFRQSSTGDWGAVMADVCQALVGYGERLGNAD